MTNREMWFLNEKGNHIKASMDLSVPGEVSFKVIGPNSATEQTFTAMEWANLVEMSGVTVHREEFISMMTDIETNGGSYGYGGEWFDHGRDIDEITDEIFRRLKDNGYTINK